jgi:hypothetical protein
MDTAVEQRAGRALQSAGYLDQQVSGKPYTRAYRTASNGYKLRADGPPEERVLWRERYQAQQFDFRGNIVFARFDCCEFAKCTLLIDRGQDN